MLQMYLMSATPDPTQPKCGGNGYIIPKPCVACNTCEILTICPYGLNRTHRHRSGTGYRRGAGGTISDACGIGTQQRTEEQKVKSTTRASCPTAVPVQRAPERMPSCSRRSPCEIVGTNKCPTDEIGQRCAPLRTAKKIIPCAEMVRGDGGYLCVPSLRTGHMNILGVVPIQPDDLHRVSVCRRRRCEACGTCAP